MRVFSRVKRKKGTMQDPYRVVPIPPKSVVRLAVSDRETPRWKRKIGTVFRVGYYGRKDGLDCIWLVNDEGDYEQTTDHEFLFKYFDIIVVSEESDLYGRERPKLPPVRKADKLKIKVGA